RGTCCLADDEPYRADGDGSGRGYGVPVPSRSGIILQDTARRGRWEGGDGMKDYDLCPCCKRPRTTIPLDELDQMDALPKPRKEQLALDAMVIAFPAAVHSDQMMQALYED